MTDGSLLTAVRVLDLALGDGSGVGRILADLGADVLKIDVTDDTPARRAAPAVDGFSLGFAVDNANKRSARLDPRRRADRRVLTELAGTADILIDSGNPSGTALFGTSCDRLCEEFGHLVALSITDFGVTGPYAGRHATDAVLYAMSSALSRTGPTSGTPLLPPDGVASATAVAQATWAALVAYFNRLRCGRGDYIDFSRYEAVVQALDPPFGSEGQAVVGRKPVTALWRGRPRNQNIYPVFDCRDGQVRICLLSARQWRGMRSWLGDPPQFAGAEFDTIATRYAASADINAAVAALFATRPVAELVAEGQRRGVPVAAVLSPAEVLSTTHFQEVGTFDELTVHGATTVTAPVGPLVIDGRHRGFVRAAPEPGSDEPRWLRPGVPSAMDAVPPTRPLSGIRILDLGVIVAGGELGRLFADLGAEVIKVESASYPDGLRQTLPGQPMSRSWALTHRNQDSLGLDLRHPAGAESFARLIQCSDAVFANFKPGTLGALGFSYERMRTLNPRIVLAESSAFGDGGPWSAHLGYGPLVRASTGISRLWTAPGAAGQTCYDATTVFPDHLVARLTGIAALAVMIGRRHTGAGGHVHISQAEAAINQFATRYAVESARARGIRVVDDASLHAVLPCVGDDEWCVVSIRSAAERSAVASVIGVVELPDDRAATIAAVSRWTATRDKGDVADRLQRAGVPAGPMNRAAEVLTDPQHRFRALFAPMRHPLIDAEMPTETAPTRFARIAPAPLRPAPMPGQQTRQVCRALLAMSDEQIDALIDAGVLFTDDPDPDRPRKASLHAS
ncbi:MAG: CoA transferase [Actinomycetota bacterium]|nr:CoA transferase [Actinomycetota bacterium]